MMAILYFTIKQVPQLYVPMYKGANKLHTLLKGKNIIYIAINKIGVFESYYYHSKLQIVPLFPNNFQVEILWAMAYLPQEKLIY